MLVGVDLVDIKRLKAACERTPRFVSRVFCSGELEYCYSKGDPYPSLAACFATREAFRKMHPVFIQGVAFHDVCLDHYPGGRPLLKLSPAVQDKAASIGITSTVVSISHTDDMAIAVTIAYAEILPGTKQEEGLR